MHPSYYFGATACILVFDVTRKGTYQVCIERGAHHSSLLFCLPFEVHTDRSHTEEGGRRDTHPIHLSPHHTRPTPPRPHAHNMQHLKKWYEELRDFCEKIPVICVANKIDVNYKVRHRVAQIAGSGVRGVVCCGVCVCVFWGELLPH